MPKVKKMDVCGKDAFGIATVREGQSYAGKMQTDVES